jgi:hypothetical protein
MNNIDIRAEWAKIKAEEQRINKLLVDYLFPVTEDMVRREANSIFESEIDRIMDKDTLPWYEARQQAIAELDKQLDDYVQEAMSNLQPDPNSQEFRQALFSRIVNKRLDDKTKKEIKQAIVDTLKKVKQTKSLDRADISQGKLASSLTLKIEGILAGKYKAETDDSLREHIKDGLYEYRNHVANGSNDKKQQNLSSVGITNEIEDICKSNILARQDLAEFILKGIYAGIKNVDSGEFSSGANKNYDRHTMARGYLYHEDGTASLPQVDIYFDSKASLAGIGSSTERFIISSQDVITHILMSEMFDDNLRAYNKNKASMDNELLLEYLVQQYGKRPIYYLIDKEKEEVYPLSYLVDEDKLMMDPGGLSLLTNEMAKGKYMIQYAKAIVKK